MRPAMSEPLQHSTTMSGAASLIRSLESAGVDTVFGIPGGAILPAYDPLLDSTKIRHVLVRHEQGAGHAAEGYAHGDERSGRDEPGHPDRRRAYGLGSDGGGHGAGAQRRDRHRRLPGGRH